MVFCGSKHVAALIFLITMCHVIHRNLPSVSISTSPPFWFFYYFYFPPIAENNLIVKVHLIISSLSRR